MLIASVSKKKKKKMEVYMHRISITSPDPSIAEGARGRYGFV
jgi:hypothetical protein